MKILILLLVLLSVWANPAHAKSVEDLVKHYSGKISWDSKTGTLVFLSSGQVDFPQSNFKNGIWQVPGNVKYIRIADGVRVAASFSTAHSLDIIGENESSSEIFGTTKAALLHNAKLDTGGGCMPYSAVYATGKDTVVNIKNLRSVDPIGFHFTGDGRRSHLCQRHEAHLWDQYDIEYV